MQEKLGNAYIIQPEEPVQIARLEKDKSKLKRLYDIGYNDGKKHYEKMVEFLEK